MLSISSMLGDESPVDPHRRRPNRPASPSMSPSPLTPGRQASITTPTSTVGIVGTATSQSSPQPPLRATNAKPSEVYPHILHARTRLWGAINLPLQSTTPAPPPSRKRKNTTPHPPTRQKRAPRPQYTKEQEDFIWFCRDDLSMSWRKVVELYNEQWHPENTGVHPMRSESGLQSRYYRILDFPVKIRKKKEPCRPELGLIPSTTRRYEWMGGGEEVEEQSGRRQHPQEQGREYSRLAVGTPMRGSSEPSFPISEPIEVDDEIDQDQVQDQDTLRSCLTGEQDADADEDKSGVRQSRLMDMETDGYESSYSSSSESTQEQQTKVPYPHST